MELESNVWVRAALQEILETLRLERSKLRVLGAWLWIHKGLELVFHHSFVTEGSADWERDPSKG